MRRGALDGVKVLDLSRILAGPWATTTLGDLGAEIWKVEAPNGDDSRSWSPPSVEGVSTYFLAANRNKKSIAIDLTRPDGRQIVLDLAVRADIVIENFRPASLAKLGLTYADFRAVNPKIIHCSISGYGRDNPFADVPGYDFIIQAQSGFMSITGEADGPPTRLGVAFVDLITGMNAVQAILAALYAREQTGEGQSIDIALFDSALHLLANISTGYLNTGKVSGRHGNAHPSIAPYQLFETVDQPIALAVGNDHQYRRLCVSVLERPELWDDQRMQTNHGRVAHREELIPLLQAEFRRRPAGHWIAALKAVGVPVGQVQDVAQAFNCDFAKVRDVIETCDHDRAGPVRTVRSPLRLSGTPTVNPTPPPLLGAHSLEIMRDVLSYEASRIADMFAAGIVFGPQAEEN